MRLIEKYDAAACFCGEEMTEKAAVLPCCGKRLDMFLLLSWQRYRHSVLKDKCVYEREVYRPQID